MTVTLMDQGSIELSSSLAYLKAFFAKYVQDQDEYERLRQEEITTGERIITRIIQSGHRSHKHELYLILLSTRDNITCTNEDYRAPINGFCSLFKNSCPQLAEEVEAQQCVSLS